MKIQWGISVYDNEPSSGVRWLWSITCSSVVTFTLTINHCCSHPLLFQQDTSIVTAVPTMRYLLKGTSEILTQSYKILKCNHNVHCLVTSYEDASTPICVDVVIIKIHVLNLILPFADEYGWTFCSASSVRHSGWRPRKGPTGPNDRCPSRYSARLSYYRILLCIVSHHQSVAS